MRIFAILSSIIFLIIPMTTTAQNNNDGVLYLDPNTSIVLPYFDTSSVVDSNIDSITLSLYVLDKTPEAPGQVQITINPIDLNNNKIGDGLSAFVDVSKDTYVDFRLPKELFEQSVQIPKRFLVNLVSKDHRLVLKGPDAIGTTQDPKLTVEHSDLNQNEVPDQPRIIEGDYYNINVSGDYVAGNKTANNIEDESIPWWLKYLLFPLFVLLVGGWLLYKFGWVG